MNENEALMEWYWPKTRIARRKTSPSAILSTTYPSWTGLELNPGLCGGRPATDRISHGRTPGYVEFKQCGKSLSTHGANLVHFSRAVG